MIDDKPIFMNGPWITDLEIKVVDDCMRGGWYDYHFVEMFEQEFAAYHGRKYGLMTPNCTTAIHLALTAMGLREGDEVIAPDCTWIGSVAGVTYLRATPVFCDIDAATWCLDPESAARGLSPRTKAMIVVDLYGNMPRMDELLALAQSHNIPVLEDAANAVGSTYKGVRAGKFGLVSVFSFHRTKTIVTGEGGMLLTDDEQLFERCRVLRDHGRRPGGPPYYNYEVAYKYMPFNLQAAMGHAQFQRLEELVGRKRSLLQQYRDLLADIPDIQLNPEPPDGVNGAWVTALVFGRSHRLTKAEAMRRLTELGLPTRPFFYPLTAMPAYAAAGAGRAPNAVAHDISDRGIILPAAPILTEAQLSRYCDGIKKIIGL